MNICKNTNCLECEKLYNGSCDNLSVAQKEKIKQINDNKTVMKTKTSILSI